MVVTLSSSRKGKPAATARTRQTDFRGVANKCGMKSAVIKYLFMTCFIFNFASILLNYMHLISMTVDKKIGDEYAISSLHIHWSHPFIHIVNTRFMQDQSDLVALSWARLHLFETFCLPTMVNQTVFTRSNVVSGDIPTTLWIIKTDPNLDTKVLQKMKELLLPYDNFYLVFSNVNFGVGTTPGGWRDGSAGLDILQESSKIQTGDLRYLELAHEAREMTVVIETRLDADDGLNLGYLENLQKKVMETMVDNVHQNVPSGGIKWKYWCAEGTLEWYSTSNFDEASINRSNNKNYDDAAGYVFIPEFEGECITPGISLAMAVGTEEKEVQRYTHPLLLREIYRHGQCGDHRGSKQCIELIQKPLISAIRSRTPTSAGMKHVEVFRSLSKQHDDIKLLWKNIGNSFGIEFDKVILTNSYIQEHLLEIAIDNMAGQCTQGHSCKQSSKEKLQKMIDILTERKQIEYNHWGNDQAIFHDN